MFRGMFTLCGAGCAIPLATQQPMGSRVSVEHFFVSKHGGRGTPAGVVVMCASGDANAKLTTGNQRRQSVSQQCWLAVVGFLLASLSLAWRWRRYTHILPPLL